MKTPVNSLEFLLHFITNSSRNSSYSLEFFIILKNLSVPRAVPLLISPTNLESLLKEHDKKGKEIKTQVNSLEFLLEFVTIGN